MSLDLKLPVKLKVGHAWINDVSRPVYTIVDGEGRELFDINTRRPSIEGYKKLGEYGQAICDELNGIPAVSVVEPSAPIAVVANGKKRGRPRKV